MPDNNGDGLAGKRPNGRAPRSGSSSHANSTAGRGQGLSSTPKNDIVAEWQRQAKQEKEAFDRSPSNSVSLDDNRLSLKNNSSSNNNGVPVSTQASNAVRDYLNEKRNDRNDYSDFDGVFDDDNIEPSVDDYHPSERATTPQKRASSDSSQPEKKSTSSSKKQDSVSGDLPAPRVASGSLSNGKKKLAKSSSTPSGGSSDKNPAKGLAGDVANIASDAAKKAVNASSLPTPVKKVADKAIPKVADKAAKSLPKFGQKGKSDKPGLGGLKGNNKAPLKGALRAGRMATMGLPLVIPILLVLLPVLLIGGCVASLGNSGDGVGSGGEIEETHGVFVPTVNVNATINENSNSDDSGKSSGSSFDGDWCYFDQETPNWDTSADGGYGISNWQQGCGVVSYAMVLASYSGDSKYTPTWCVQNGLAQAFSGGAMVMESQMVNYVNDHQDVFHLKAEGAGVETGWKNDWERVKRVTAAGGCVMISSNSIGTNSGIHYVVITKVENGTVTFKNPWGGKEQTCTEEFATTQATYDIGGNTTKSIWFEKI